MQVGGPTFSEGRIIIVGDNFKYRKFRLCLDLDKLVLVDYLLRQNLSTGQYVS